MLYARVPHAYSIGMTYHEVARISATDEEREKYIAAAREAWSSIGRQGLINQLDREIQYGDSPLTRLRV